VTVPVVPLPRKLQAPATSVPLGTAGSFAVLAGSGITNTGATTIKGDVGSSPTPAETGFAACPAANCVTLTGANHTSPTPNDAVTVKAKIDLTTAYNYAAGQVSTQVATELANQRLVAGVYSSASGTFQMTGTLVLDGQNKTNGVWIFQTASTLVTGGTGNVSLIRGAQACDVFYQVGSAATLGAGSTLKGTILAHDTISLGNGVTVQGRLLAGEQASGAGAVTLIHDTIVSPLCVTTTPPSSPPNTTPPGTTPPGTTPPGTTPPGTTPTGTTPPGTTPTGTTPPGTTPTGTTPTGTTPTGTTPTGTTPTGTIPTGTTPTGVTPTGTIPTGTTPTGTTPIGMTPVGTTPTGTTPTGATPLTTATTPRTVLAAVTTPTTGTPTTGTPTTGTPTTGTPTTSTPTTGTPTTGTPTSTGPQVGQVPLGGVHAGDGSTIAATNAGSGAGLLPVAALALAGLAGAAGLTARLRRRDS